MMMTYTLHMPIEKPDDRENKSKYKYNYKQSNIMMMTYTHQ